MAKKKYVPRYGAFMVLTDMNPDPEAMGRQLHIHRDHVVTFYVKTKTPNVTLVLTADGKTYDVAETPAEIRACMAGGKIANVGGGDPERLVDDVDWKRRALSPDNA